VLEPIQSVRTLELWEVKWVEFSAQEMNSET
jgi:hypothetical protein